MIHIHANSGHYHLKNCLIVLLDVETFERTDGRMGEINECDLA